MTTSVYLLDLVCSIQLVCFVYLVALLLNQTNETNLFNRINQIRAQLRPFTYICAQKTRYDDSPGRVNESALCQ
jgi:hypothetical protein